MKLFLAASILLLGGAILWVSSGFVGPLAAAVTEGIGGLVSKVGIVASSPDPTATPGITDAPSIDGPNQPYTNQATINITVNVPIAVTGQEGYSVRLYVTLPDAEPDLLADEPVGATARQVLSKIQLAPGRNDIQAAIFGPGGESERSAIATWILDTSKPKVSIISPKDNAQVSKTTITIKGKSQASAEIRLVNAANGAIATATAGKDGLWQVPLAVTAGSNVITVTATDPAGNGNTTTLTCARAQASWPPS